MRPVTQHDVNNFAQKVQGLVDAAGVEARVCVSFGRRYARIYKEWGNQSICWGWVDMTNGDIRRGGWKAPDMRAPARGKITDAGIIRAMHWTGPPYMTELS